MSRRRSNAAAAHECGLAALLTADDWDEIDEAAADPILDRMPQERGRREADSLLSILDELKGKGEVQ